MQSFYFSVVCLAALCTSPQVVTKRKTAFPSQGKFSYAAVSNPPYDLSAVAPACHPPL